MSHPSVDTLPEATPVPESDAVARAAAHDAAPPPALVDFMVARWAPRGAAPEPLERAAYFRARREILSGQFPGDVLVVPSGNEKVRANDTHYRFRPGTDFYYLTGNVEPDCVLVMRPVDGGHDARLYVEPNPGKTDATFFTDRAKGELWVGARLGVAESAVRFGLDAAALGDLPASLDGVATQGARVRALRGIDPGVDARIASEASDDTELAAALSEMRLVKDPYEVAELQRAIDATHRAFEDVLAALPASKTERHVEGVFNLRARVDGNDVGYNTIAASGAHACTLHWNANDGTLHPGELLLLDAGVEATSLYTADVTRTIPLSGTFSHEQREIYDLVLAAQDAGFEACRPGNDFLAPNVAAMAVLAHGLERLGILPTTAQEALDEANQFYKRYSLHGVSHMLGLDVHDCARARQENYRHGKLVPGMVLTIEPGLYFQVDDLTVPERYRGIGVRIEDDVLVTDDGCRNLSVALPREAGAIEAWVRASARRGFALP